MIGWTQRRWRTRNLGGPVKIKYKESQFLESDARNRFTDTHRERI